MACEAIIFAPKTERMRKQAAKCAGCIKKMQRQYQCVQTGCEDRKLYATSRYKERKLIGLRRRVYINR